MQDITDRCLEDTAIRETTAKLGISPSNVEIWTGGNLIATRGDTSIIPILGRVKSQVKQNSFRFDSNEIQEVFTVPVEDLCNSSMLRYTQFRNYCSVPVFLGIEKRIWGITAVMTNMCLSSILPSKAYYHRIRYVSHIRRNKIIHR